MEQLVELKYDRFRSKTEKVYIYRPFQEIEIIHDFDQPLSGEGILEGFKLDLKSLA
jgi:hypothetical protein